MCTLVVSDTMIMILGSLLTSTVGSSNWYGVVWCYGHQMMVYTSLWPGWYGLVWFGVLFLFECFRRRIKMMVYLSLTSVVWSSQAGWHGGLSGRRGVGHTPWGSPWWWFWWVRVRIITWWPPPSSCQTGLASLLAGSQGVARHQPGWNDLIMMTAMMMLMTRLFHLVETILPPGCHRHIRRWW